MSQNNVGILCIIAVFFVGNCLGSENSDKLQNCLSDNLTECTKCREGSCGKFCDKSCSGSCLYDCDITTCECRACADGFHGRNCSLNCSAYCGTYLSKKASCKRNTGACKNGCQLGRCLTEKGCIENCSTNCINGTCLNEDCTCIHGCVDGYWGAICRKRCRGCTQCDENNGTCLIPGTHSEDLQCSGCTGERCERSVVCRAGCQPGRHGEKCEKSCPQDCETCNQVTGLCDSGCSSLSALKAAGITLGLCVVASFSMSVLFYTRSHSSNESKKKKWCRLASAAVLVSIIIIIIVLFSACFK